MINRRTIFWIILICVVGYVCSCSECEDGEIQCEDTTVVICEDETWEPYDDCSEYDTEDGFKDAGPYVCCEFALTAYCVPKSACEEIIYR